MSTPRRTLDKLFASARSETSPISAEDTRSLVSGTSTVTGRNPLMSPTLLATAAAALIATAGITVKVIHDDVIKPKVVVDEQASSSAVQHAESPLPTASKVSAADADGEQGADGKTPTTSTHMTVTVTNDGTKIIRTVRSNDEVVTENVYGLDYGDIGDADRAQFLGVFALRADDDIYQALGVEPSAVQNICKNLAGADSLSKCSANLEDTKVKVCMFKDGATDEVIFMDRPGPLPVMFTSADGKGRVLSNFDRASVDPNTLVPVAAHGCGDNMLMWFQPSEEFVFSMPDSLQNDLESVLAIEQEVRIVTKDGKTTVTRKYKNPDGSTSETVDVFPQNDVNLFFKQPSPPVIPNVPDGMQFNQAELDSVIRMALKNVDSTMQDVQIDLDKRMKELNLQIDSMNKRIEIQFSDSSGMFDFKTWDSVRQQLKMQFKLDGSDANFDLEDFMQWNDSDGANIIIQKDAQCNVQKVAFSSNPNFTNRIIIISTASRKTSTVPAVLENGSLQETRMSEGAVSSSTVYPNPTSEGGATMRFSLTEPRIVSLNLHNLSGEIIERLEQDVYRGPGEWQFAFAINDVPPGMYLVTLTTDRGERAVQRLIVQ